MRKITSHKQSKTRKTRYARNGAASSREMFAAIDESGQEAWIQLLDQDIRTFGEAAQRDYDAFLQVVYALERAGYRGDATIRALAKLDTDRVVEVSTKKEIAQEK